MTEAKEREAYRMRCKHYSMLSGLCCKKSIYYCKGALTVAYDVLCTPDCGCARMKKYDKRKKG